MAWQSRTRSIFAVPRRDPGARIAWGSTGRCAYARNCFGKAFACCGAKMAPERFGVRHKMAQRNGLFAIGCELRDRACNFLIKPNPAGFNEPHDGCNRCGLAGGRPRNKAFRRDLRPYPFVQQCAPAKCYECLTALAFGLRCFNQGAGLGEIARA